MKKFIHGNTYYSHANPPEELERNFKKMREMGINAVRVAEIWPGWSVIEHKPGEYDFKLLDDYVEKAVRSGIRVCMGVGINDTPFWLYTKYPDLRCRNFDGQRAVRRVQSACIDHMEYREHMKKYIEAITKHYAGWEGIFSWQLGNEIRYGVPICDCPSTRIRFREWLKEKYQDNLDALNREWGTYYNEWEEIYPYKSYDGPPTEGVPTHCLRTMQFQGWSLEELIDWGSKIMRKYTDLPIFHNNNGTPNMKGTHWNLCKPCDVVVIDIYATTYEKPGFYNGLLLDAARSIATQQNKPLWIGETSAGQYGTYNRIPVDRRVIENCVIEQIGTGASAVFYFRHKPNIWEQPHKFTGSQTFLRPDESEMIYTETPKRVASFMNRYEDRILSAKPIRPEIGLYYPGESILYGREAGYSKNSQASAYGSRAIWAGASIPIELMDADTITSMDLSIFKMIYMPISYLLPSTVGAVLKKYVEDGGILICESRPGYVNEAALLYKKQPGAGLHEVFGALEDLFYDTDEYEAIIKLDGKELDVNFTVLKQTYRLIGGEPFITTKNGEIVGVKNAYGKGYAYIMGGAPSLHYPIGAGKYDTGGKKTSNPKAGKQQRIFCDFFADLAAKYEVFKPVKFTGGNPEMTVRYLKNENETILFMINYNMTEDSEIVFDSSYRQVNELGIDDEFETKTKSIIVPAMGWKCISVK